VKKIVTHINPDLDAVTSVWLIKRFLPGWEDVEVEFVSATASTEKQTQADQNPEVLWVDVGRGKLDHHQTGRYLSATKLCFDLVKKERQGQPLGRLGKKALVALVGVVTEIDNARDLNWPEVSKNRYYLYLYNLFDGLRKLGETDEQVLEFGFRALDGVLLNLKNKIKAEEELKDGLVFETPWGRAIAVETGNENVLFFGETQGFVLVVKKDPESGGVRIYARPDSKVDLTDAYHLFQKLDQESDWFLHATKRLLLNHSSVNQNMRPTKLTLEKIVEILSLP